MGILPTTSTASTKHKSESNYRLAMGQSHDVLVTGATGNQGGALSRLLLKKGHRVKALVRSPDHAAAKELEGLGAEVITGNFNDVSSIQLAAQGVEAMFAVATPYSGPEVETRHGMNLANAAKGAGVMHLLYSSVANANRDTGIEHFDSKCKVEEHIKTLDIPHTIVAPAYVMDNLLSPWSVLDFKSGQLKQPLPPSRKLQQISYSDIAAFMGIVLERRDQFIGKRIDIASDEVSGLEVADTLSQVTGHTIQYVKAPIEGVEVMYQWFDQVGYTVDIASLHNDYPEIKWHTFEEWARGQDWSMLES